jgi:hypothetical protein
LTKRGRGSASIQCAITASAQIADYANNGLTSESDFGGACPIVAGFSCAFPGINPNAPPLPFLESIGRSVYNGLQVRLTGHWSHPPVLRSATFQFFSALSRKSHSAVFNNVTLLHCAQNLPQYQFARDRWLPMKLHGVANGRDQCRMVPFSRSKGKFQFQQ